ncbi:MAG: K(+)-transporting ATPase subunit F [Woeseiaceae bacterium]
MTLESAFLGLIALILFIYLLVTIFRPERF